MKHAMQNQIFLKKGDLLEIGSKAMITVGSGVIWVTCSGDHQDYILRGGDQLALVAARPVIEALEASSVVIIEPPSKLSLLSSVFSWDSDAFEI